MELAASNPPDFESRHVIGCDRSHGGLWDSLRVVSPVHYDPREQQASRSSRVSSDIEEAVKNRPNNVFSSKFLSPRPMRLGAVYCV